MVQFAFHDESRSLFLKVHYSFDIKSCKTNDIYFLNER
jgi:hypothetical protein